MHTNSLINESSPYLLQHAHNPVNWHAWGPEAFEKARTEDKPIFLSIGYSTCHWCHVMERESFEMEDVAEVLNRHFVPVKVDREERPDVDRIYMAFVQATSGSGGWPMSVWLTPDLKPFFGGTYFPPDNRYGRPGFKNILEQLAAAWQNERERIVESSTDVVEQLKGMSRVIPEAGSFIDPGVLESGFFQFRRTFDSRLGGFGGAPKFPRAVAYNFLFRYFYRTGNEEASEMVLFTLREMAKGGMNDQLGGGFHRYSVDARWFVPHFEKMLYDQAQLAVSYLEAYQISRDGVFAETARDIFEYVLRDMTDADGGFFSAEDADSVVDPAKPEEKGEGAFYIWTQDEIERILGKPTADWFSYRYGVKPDGNVDEDPHHEFTGRNILYQAHTIEETAERFGADVERVSETLRDAQQKLVAERSKRVRPHLDDKVLTSWNGLMISALAKGFQVLGEERYLAAAQRAADFLLSRMYDGNLLLRRYRAGDAAIPGFLDDYAFLTQALLDLYEADFDSRHLQAAIELTGRMLDLFEDTENGAFFSTAAGDEDLVLRMKEDYDGAEPSGNSIAVLNLLRLAKLTGSDRYREAAHKALRAFSSRLRGMASSVPQMLAALQYSVAAPKQVVLVGSQDAPDTREFLRTLHSRFLPDHAVLLIENDQSRKAMAAHVPVLADMKQQDGRATAYVCENFACQLPTADLAKFSELLQ
ncbi:MAG: thioredoxin domain-containing protein [Bryobacteraceae bacterium]